MNNFIHLHVHSYFSLLRGASSIDSLIKKTKKNKQIALALTDTNAVYGAVEFYKKALQANIKPIIGSLVEDENNERAIIIAKNLEGYRQLCQIITALKLSEENPNIHNKQDFIEINKEKFSISKYLIENNFSENLIILSDSLSFITNLLKNHFKNNLYAEIYKPNNKTERENVRNIIRISEKRGIPLVVSNRVYFANRHDYLIHRLLTAIRLLTTIESIPEDNLVSKSCFLKSTDEMINAFKDFPDAIKNTLKISEMCELKLPLGINNYPLFSLPNKDDSKMVLRDICYKSISKRYEESKIKKAQERLDYELEIICQKGYADYFLIVKDIVDYANSKKIPSVGRGSAADSIVSYLLGITDVDPIKHNLYFERFLNPDRIDPPDIDVDFCWKRRDYILNYVYEKYGFEKVAMISTHVRFELRSSIRETGKVLGFSESEMNDITQRLPHFGADDIEGAFKKIPEAATVDTSSKHIKQIIKLAKKIGGFPRHIGMHPSGLVITPSPLNNWTPLERAAKGLIITQYEMHAIEELGLLKIDLLGQRSLSVIADTVESISKNNGIKIITNKIPMEDKKTKQLMRSGKTIGCFQIESPGMCGLLRKLKVDEFEILTAASSLIRPGPKDSGMMKNFIRRHLKMEPVVYLHPVMKKVLSDTYGVMVYQEDVLKIAQIFAGMSLGRADLLRRSMSAKKGAIPLMEFKEEFFAGAAKKGYDDKLIEKVWRQLYSFAGYAFCKAHSASYAKISFQAAYLKAHHPAEFFAAVISNGGGFYDREAYVSEARRWGLKIFLPSINNSNADWIGRDSQILCGLAQIKNISEDSIKNILAEREKGKFLSLTDFFIRTKLPSSETELIISSGCLDEFGYSRPQIFFIFQTFLNNKKSKMIQKDLLEIKDDDKNIPILNNLSEEELFYQEYKALDVPIRFHPLKLFQDKIKQENVILAKDINKHKNKTVKIAGWMVTHRRVRTSKNEIMKFVTLEDETDIYDTVLFPDIYKKFGAIILTRGPYMVTGKITHDHSVCSIEVQDVKLIR